MQSVVKSTEKSVKFRNSFEGLEVEGNMFPDTTNSTSDMTVAPNDESSVSKSLALSEKSAKSSK